VSLITYEEIKFSQALAIEILVDPIGVVGDHQISPGGFLIGVSVRAFTTLLSGATGVAALITGVAATQAAVIVSPASNIRHTNGFEVTQQLVLEGFGRSEDTTPET